MKKLSIILLLVSACKKKHQEPTPEPEPIPTPICVTSDTLLSGKWKLQSDKPSDTITIRFKNNNCPKEKSNTYVIDNFTTTIAPVSNTIITKGTFTITSDERTKSADRTQKDYYFYIDDKGVLLLSAGGLLKYGTVGFDKVK